MKAGDKVIIESAAGHKSDGVFVSGPYNKDMAKHFGCSEPFIMSFVKVRRFIKAQNKLAKTATEYTKSQVYSG